MNEAISGETVGWAPSAEEAPAPRTPNEIFYDRELARAIRTIARKCHAHGMSFLAIVECDATNPRRQVTRAIGQTISVPMVVANLAADAGGNVDQLVMQTRDFVSHHGIRHESAILQAVGLDPDPEKRTTETGSQS